MSDIVNREVVEHLAGEAADLLNASASARAEGWLKIGEVAGRVEPASNLGVKGICYGPFDNGKPAYIFKLECVEGLAHGKLRAPDTLEKARDPRRLESAIAALGRKVTELGGEKNPDRFAAGTGPALLDVMKGSPSGRTWLDGRSDDAAAKCLLVMARVAVRYGQENLYPPAGLTAHVAFLTFPNRAALVRKYPTSTGAQIAAAMMRRGESTPSAPARATTAEATKLALRAGVSTREARVILGALRNGRSKRTLIRAINEGAAIVAEKEARAGVA